MKNLFKVLVVMIIALFACNTAQCKANQCHEYGYATQVRASHILVNTKQEADLIKSKINDGESFETLAKRYSKCPSGQQGGDLGYFERGQMVKPFEDAAFSLPVGKVSEPVQTQFGWHLIKVSDRK